MKALTMKNRIKELRLKAGLTQDQLAKEVGLSEQAISFYELKQRNPKIDKWEALANYFNVSIPYLQGYDDLKIPADLKFSSKRDAIAYIKRIMRVQGISKEDLEKSISDEKPN